MKLNYSHIIWDWNGTIIDDAQLCVDLVNSLLDLYGLKRVDLNFYRNNFQFPVKSYYSLLGLPNDSVNHSKISNEFIHNYRKLFIYCELQNGVNNNLNKLQNLGIGHSVLSAGMQSDLNSFVAHFKLKHFFQIISGVENILSKGKIEISLNHLRNLRTDSSKILMVGDTLHDSEVAELLGVDCLLFSNGHNSAQLLSKARFPIIQNINEIYEYVID